jgi:hypothetical protein
MVRLRPFWRVAFPVFLLAALVMISTRAARPQEQESSPHLTPKEVRLYRQARTPMDWTPEEIRVNRDLQHLQPAESQRDLPAILQKVGESVAMLFQALPNITCTEKVWSHVGLYFPSQFVHDQDSTRWFRYLLLVHMGQGAPVLEEYRTDMDGNTIADAQSLHAPMLTSRFISTALIFHPQNQAASRFRYFGRQMLEGRETEVVGFAQIPEGDPAVSVFRNRNKTAGLLVQGLAWIDAASQQLLRIQTDSLAPRLDVGLEVLATELDFSDIHLADSPATFRLPTRVSVDVWIIGERFRNIHEYSDFKLFRVESHIGPTPQD